MIRPYIRVINILLSILALFLVNEIYNLWKPGEAIDFSYVATQTQALVRIPELSDSRIPPRKVYQDIVEKDLFRPERTEWVPPSTPNQEGISQIAEPTIRVYGIVIYDDLKNAWIKEQLQKVRVSNKIQLIVSDQIITFVKLIELFQQEMLNRLLEIQNLDT